MHVGRCHRQNNRMYSVYVISLMLPVVTAKLHQDNNFWSIVRNCYVACDYVLWSNRQDNENVLFLFAFVKSFIRNNTSNKVMHEGISVNSIDSLTYAHSNPQNLLIRFIENTHHTAAVCIMYDSVCKASTNWVTLCIIRWYFYRRITHTITPSFNRVFDDS